MKCHRTACKNTISDPEHTATHRDTGNEYCIPCARRINAACPGDDAIVIWPALERRRAAAGPIERTVIDLVEPSGRNP